MAGPVDAAVTARVCVAGNELVVPVSKTELFVVGVVGAV
jgi:hypothetical protein